VAPVGPNLAVFVRAGYYMWGCSDESNLRAGETVELAVTIIDKPHRRHRRPLGHGPDFVPEVEPWAALLACKRRS